jgi:hypothetical protein
MAGMETRRPSLLVVGFAAFCLILAFKQVEHALSVPDAIWLTGIEGGITGLLAYQIGVIARRFL